MKRLIMPLLAALLAFAFWPSFAADTVPEPAIYASTLDANQGVADVSVPVPAAVWLFGSTLTDDNVPVDNFWPGLVAMAWDESDPVDVECMACAVSVTPRGAFVERWPGLRPPSA